MRVGVRCCGWSAGPGLIPRAVVERALMGHWGRLPGADTMNLALRADGEGKLGAALTPAGVPASPMSTGLSPALLASRLPAQDSSVPRPVQGREPGVPPGQLQEAGGAHPAPGPSEGQVCRIPEETLLSSRLAQHELDIVVEEMESKLSLNKHHGSSVSSWGWTAGVGGLRTLPHLPARAPLDPEDRTEVGLGCGTTLPAPGLPLNFGVWFLPAWDGVHSSPHPPP